MNESRVSITIIIEEDDSRRKIYNLSDNPSKLRILANELKFEADQLEERIQTLTARG